MNINLLHVYVAILYAAKGHGGFKTQLNLN